MSIRYYVVVFIISLLVLAGCTGNTNIDTSATLEILQTQEVSKDWQEEFGILDCTLVTTGQNPYFILEPGFQLVLEGGNTKLMITVLDETMVVDDVETRVVEEREWKNDELIEVSQNMFAMCEETQDVFYFGEFVDMYSNGELTSHSGQWFAGEEDARAGMIMPGKPSVGMRFYQEIAPGVAMDRAEVISVDETFGTPAGEYSDVLVTKEGTALNPFENEFKSYALGIGLIQDQNLRLVEYGFVELE